MATAIGPSRRLLRVLGSGGLRCFEPLVYGAADPPTGRDVDAVRPGPGRDRRVVRAHLGGRATATAPAGATADPAAAVSPSTPQILVALGAFILGVVLLSAGVSLGSRRKNDVRPAWTLTN
jgi:hypothetical protein